MYHQPKPQQQASRFRRFSRAAWAAYSSMHRELTIGRLSVRVADRSLAKAAATVALGLVLAQGTATAQSGREGEARTLPEVQVTLTADSLLGSPEPAAVLTADDFDQTTIRSIGDLVAQLPGVDLRVRGGADVQADLSMRGGTFDQMVVLLGGVNLTDAQTGHHTMDLPLDLAMVERVELLSPAQAMARGIVAFCGAVNIVVRDEYRDCLLATLSGGSYGTADASLLATRTLGPWALTAAAAYHRSDGYRPNTDYRHGSLLVQALRHSEADDLHLQFGGQMKGFGGAGFYSTTYPDQYEATRTLVGSAFHVHRWHTTRLETALYGRLHADRFELFREGYAEAPVWYGGHNHHLSSLGGLRSRVVTRLGVGEALLGIDLRHEGIASNVLGRADSTLPPPYTRHDARTGGSLFAGYHYADRHWNAEAVALGNLNSRFGFHPGLAAEVQYSLAPMTLHLTASRTYRLPSFTDLYYQSANQRANPDLGAESSTSVDLGATWRRGPLRGSLAAWGRKGSQIIDWVRRADEEVWYSMNHTAVDAVGLDLQAGLTLRGLTVQGAYSFCHVMQDAGEWISGSAMDYLRHSGRLLATWSPTARLRLKADATYRWREGQWVDADGAVQPYGGVLLLGAGVDYDLGACTLYAECHNMLDRTWRDHGGVPQPGRTFMAGLRLRVGK